MAKYQHLHDILSANPRFTSNLSFARMLNFSTKLTSLNSAVATTKILFSATHSAVVMKSMLKSAPNILGFVGFSDEGKPISAGWLCFLSDPSVNQAMVFRTAVLDDSRSAVAKEFPVLGTVLSRQELGKTMVKGFNWTIRNYKDHQNYYYVASRPPLVQDA